LASKTNISQRRRDGCSQGKKRNFEWHPSIKDFLGEKLNFSEKKLGNKLTYKDVEIY